MRCKTIVFLSILFWNLASFAQPAADFVNLLNTVNSMQSDFKQTIYDNRERAVQTAYGNMSFVRPGKFRWQVKKPIPQLIIANGTKLWIYDPDLRQVIIRSLQRAVGDTPALLLSHVSNNLEDDFIITEDASTASNLRWFNLKPRKKDSMFAAIKMGFADNKQIKEMQLKDQLGHTTKVEFSHARLNPTIAASAFEFKNPPRVDVIDETQKK